MDRGVVDKLMLNKTQVLPVLRMKASETKKEIVQLKKDLGDIEELIKILQDLSVVSSETNKIIKDGYNPILTLPKKIIIVLKALNRPMTGREMSLVVKELEPHLDLKKILNSVPTTLTQLSKKNKIIKVSKPGSPMTYSLPLTESSANWVRVGKK
jgi:hypothetical protein